MPILSDIDRHTPEERKILRGGFPAALAEEVDHVRRIMPVPPTAKSGPGQMVELDGERLFLIYRQHYDPLERSYLEVFTPRQRVIFDCLYSRHANGRFREISLRQLVGADEAWVRPYLTLPLADYAIEVAGIAAAQRNYLLSDAGLEFASNNADLIAYMLPRAISYWNEHYRGRYPKKGDYPPVAILLQISREIR